MSSPRKRILATAVATCALALPATAGARMDEGHVGNTPSPVPAVAVPVAHADSGSGFEWGDAGLGAGGMLLLLAPAGTMLVLGRRSQRI